MSALAPTLEAFFTQRLPQRRASPHTVAAYRDTWRLLLNWAHVTTGTAPCELGFNDLDATVIAAFLDHLEADRGASIATRNARLAAVHSLFGFAATRHPEHAQLISRVLAIDTKRGDHSIVTYLTPDEAETLLAAPDPATRIGRRDRALLQVAIQTGLRASELVSLRRRDLHLTSPGAHVCCHGQGRKDRHTPLTAVTGDVLREWLAEHGGHDEQAVFPGPSGRPLGRDALRRLLDRHTHVATTTCPSLASKRVTPTCCATPAPCDFSKPASTPPSSPCGSVTSHPARPRSISTPTSH